MARNTYIETIHIKNQLRKNKYGKNRFKLRWRVSQQILSTTQSNLNFVDWKNKHCQYKQLSFDLGLNESDFQSIEMETQNHLP